MNLTSKGKWKIANRNHVVGVGIFLILPAIQFLVVNHCLAEIHPKTVKEATLKVLSQGEVQHVLQNLLRERVQIRDLATILEAIADAGSLTRNAKALTEAERTALARTICAGLASEDGELTVLTLAPRLEREFADRFGLLGGVQTETIEPEFGRALLEKIEAATQAAVLSQPIILCSAAVRSHLRRLTERFLPDLSVIAHGEGRQQCAPHCS